METSKIIRQYKKGTMVAYERCSFTRGLNCSDLLGKFWCFEQVITYGSWLLTRGDRFKLQLYWGFWSNRMTFLSLHSLFQPNLLIYLFKINVSVKAVIFQLRFSVGLRDLATSISWSEKKVTCSCETHALNIRVDRFSNYADSQ